MSAGTGVMHSEFNHAPDAETHFLQIWIEPHTRGIAPGYEQKTFAQSDTRGKLRLVASPDGAEGSVQIHSDARLFAGLFDGAESISLPLTPSRKGYVFVVKGAINANGEALNAGDALLMDAESVLNLSQGQGAEVLFFDLAY